MSLLRIERRLRFRYHWRAIDTVLVCSIVLKMCQQKHSRLMISFSNHHHLYSFVNISSIKAGTEVVEYLSMLIIERRFRFCYHWRDIDTALVCSVSLKISQQNHSHLMISFSNHHHIYYFVHISSIKAGT